MGKIRGEKSRKTSQECRSVLRCKFLSALTQRQWKGEQWTTKRHLQLSRQLQGAYFSPFYNRSVSKTYNAQWHSQKCNTLAIQSISCPPFESFCLHGLTKCLHIISVRQHELIFFCISVGEKGGQGKSSEISADRNIC